jgi:hypothetical protein
MRFRLYREHGALNSVPVFDAFEQGLKSLGHESVTDNEDVAVIWSVLWAGRMKANRQIYYECKNLNKPVIIIEVGNLKRGETWRISLDHINNQGIFGNAVDLDNRRPATLDVKLKPIPAHRRGEILIACQHQDSLQWEGMPLMKTWCEEIITKIKQHTHRRIIVRPHPRSSFPFKMSGILFERPQRVPNTYDDFNILYGYHCVINYNSGPAVQAAIQGIPILCDSSSLAAPMSTNWETLDNPQLPDREEWFLKLCHTEWTVKEIVQGIPLQRLLPEIVKKIS